LLYVYFLDHIHDRSDRAVLPRVNLYDSYDEKKFREQFRLLKQVILHLSDIWQYPPYFISFVFILFITRRQNCQPQFTNTADMTLLHGARSRITCKQSAVGSIDNRIQSSTL